jgi:hypothetical protein
MPMQQLAECLETIYSPRHANFIILHFEVVFHQGTSTNDEQTDEVSPYW